MSEEEFHAIPKSNSKRVQRTIKTRSTATVSLNYVNRRHTGNRRYSDKQGDVECLAKAIQKNIVELVNDMPFNESSIPDELISNGCITEDECKLVREKQERKSQVRKIVNLIKCRSFTTIEKFLNVVGKENNCPRIVSEIWGHYKELLKTNFIGDKCCGVCKVKKHVDVRYVIDKLWQETAIPDSLYEQLCDTETVKAQQGNLWDSILKECNEKKKLEILIAALESKGHYCHVAKELRAQFYLGNCTGCACLSQLGNYSREDSSASCTTYLPNSSNSNSLTSLQRNENIETENSELHEDVTDGRTIHSENLFQSDQTHLVPDVNKSGKKYEKAVQMVEMDTCFPMVCFSK